MPAACRGRRRCGTRPPTTATSSGSRIREARHSRNVAARREVGIAIFDSDAPIGTGRGVYVAAVAEEVAGTEREHGIGVFSRRSVEHGASAWTVDDVQGPARLRLYRATAVERYVGERDDRRLRIEL